MYNLKSSEKLFNEWKRLGFDVQRVGDIVQNDIEINDEDIERFARDLDSLLLKITALGAQTVVHIIEKTVKAAEDL